MERRKRVRNIVITEKSHQQKACAQVYVSAWANGGFLLIYSNID